MKKLSPWQADLLLLAVAFTWGVTFIIVKKALQDISPFAFLAIRFTMAFLFLLLFDKQCRKTPRSQTYPFLYNKKVLHAGGVIGFFLFSGYAFQTAGLQYTSASNAAFITGLSVVLVPLLSTCFTKRLPNPYVLLGALVAALGLGLLTLEKGYSLQKGDLLILLCAFSFAMHIISVGHYTGQFEAASLSILQIGLVGLLSCGAVYLIPGESWPATWTLNIWIALLLTAIPATSLAILVQNSVQQYTSPARTAIVFSMEPVFGALSAWYLAGESFTQQGLWGAALVLVGMLLAELKN